MKYRAKDIAKELGVSTATISLVLNDKPGVGVQRRKEIIDNIANTVQFAEKVGLAAGLIFTIIASLIIFNTIRMAIFNRREEIHMMKLIGANKSFIRGPFIVEAVVCGVLAAIFASAIGYAIIYFAKQKLEAYGITVEPLINILQQYAILVVLSLMSVGSVIGVMSSITATRKYLKI